MNVTVKGDNMLCIGAPDTNIIIEEGMTWNEWINSSYKTESDGGYFEFIEPNLMSYITPGGYAECGFYIDSLDTKIVEDSHVIYFGYNQSISFTIQRACGDTVECIAEDGMTLREWYNSSYSSEALTCNDDGGAFRLENLELYENDGVGYAYLWRNFENFFGGDGYGLCYNNEDIVLVNADKPIMNNGSYIEAYTNIYTDI